jgi:hypothetical protein
VLPLEHALIAVAAATIATRLRAAPASALLVVAASLFGFAVRAGREHAQLRDREGGRPMFEPTVVHAAGADAALLFVDTDHGYNLAATPGAAWGVARWRGDALDWMAWDAAGRPTAFRYRFDWTSGVAQPALERLELPPPSDAAVGQRALPATPMRIEGESLWPARAQRAAWALPEHASGTCASGGRWLRVRALPARSGVSVANAGGVEVTLPAPWLRGRRITPVLALEHGSAAHIVVRERARQLASSPRLEAAGPQPGVQCLATEPMDIPMETTDLTLELQLASHSGDALIALDHVEIQAAAGVAQKESR